MTTFLDNVGLQMFKNIREIPYVQTDMSVNWSAGESCETNSCLERKHCLIAGVGEVCKSVHSLLRQVSG